MTSHEWKGEAHRVLPRFYQRNLQAAAVKRPAPTPAAPQPAPAVAEGLLVGREGELRGIPVIGRGVGGASDGSDPLRALIAKQPRDDAGTASAAWV